MRLFLVGLPGSGKSTIGQQLSKILNLPLVDTDDLICNQEQQTIEQLFLQRGENYFRELEKKTLHDLISKDNIIISTGGGLPCFFDNMEIINKNGVSIYLKVTPESIAERLWTTKNSNRPLVQGKSKEELLEFLKTKLKERLPYYTKATITATGDNLTGTIIRDELLAKNLI